MIKRQSNSSGTLSGGEETPIGVRKARFHQSVIRGIEVRQIKQHQLLTAEDNNLGFNLRSQRLSVEFASKQDQTLRRNNS